MKAEHEQTRYQRLYERGYPPGNPERLVVWAGAKLNEKVIDLGCGRATLSRIFHRYTGIDFADKAFPTTYPKHMVFEKAFLHDLPASIKENRYDLAVCADVMEHIAPEEVNMTLDSLLALDASRFLLSVCCRPSNWKDEEGQLHLTIEEPKWWADKLIERGGGRWIIHASIIMQGTVYFELLRF